MAKPTFTHSYSKEVNQGGFSQWVPLPSDPQSNQLASYWSTVQGARVALDHATVAYTLVLPLGAIITGVKVLLSTVFSAASTLALGSTLGGVDILAATAITAQVNALAIVPTIPVSSVDDQTIFVTIGGAPAAGAGLLIVEYVNPPATLNGIND